MPPEWTAGLVEIDLSPRGNLGKTRAFSDLQWSCPLKSACERCKGKRGSRPPNGLDRELGTDQMRLELSEQVDFRRKPDLGRSSRERSRRTQYREMLQKPKLEIATCFRCTRVFLQQLGAITGVKLRPPGRKHPCPGTRPSRAEAVNGHEFAPGACFFIARKARGHTATIVLANEENFGFLGTRPVACIRRVSRRPSPPRSQSWRRSAASSGCQSCGSSQPWMSMRTAWSRLSGSRWTHA